MNAHASVARTSRDRRDPKVEETRTRIAGELAALGVRPGGALLVHASLRSLGEVPGGAETVVLGLLDALGPHGTLLMPALSYRNVDAERPVFDQARTPSCVGALTEHFRTRPGTLRSLHPTHSISAAGPEAEALLADHHLDSTPCGGRSALRRLRDRDGQVLFLGCGLRPNTSMHAVEELVEPPYLFGGMVHYRLLRPDGSELAANVRRHSFVVSGRRFAQHYDRIAPLLPGGALRTGRVLAAECDLLACPAMWAAGEAALRRDPWFFVEEEKG